MNYCIHRMMSAKAYMQLSQALFRGFIVNSEGVEQTIGFYLPGELMGLDAYCMDDLPVLRLLWKQVQSVNCLYRA